MVSAYRFCFKLFYYLFCDTYSGFVLSSNKLKLKSWLSTIYLFTINTYHQFLHQDNWKLRCAISMQQRWKKVARHSDELYKFLFYLRDSLPVSFFRMSLMSLAFSLYERMSWRMSFSVMCWARPRTMMVQFGGTLRASSSALQNIKTLCWIFYIIRLIFSKKHRFSVTKNVHC